MKEAELNRLYKKVAKEIGFRKDSTHKGWMPKLGPNDFKCKIIHGFTGEGPVTLTVGPSGLVDSKARELLDSYASLKKKKFPCIVLPKVLGAADFEIENLSWVVRERVDGARPLKNFPLSDGQEKTEIAKLYWNTVAVFSEMEEQNQMLGRSGDLEDFMRERLDKWVELGKSSENKRNKKKLALLDDIAGDVFRYIFYETNIWESADLEIEPFFKNFGNTDIVLQNNNFYLPSPEVIPLPQFYGAAYFVWNVLMYSYECYDSSTPVSFPYEGVAEEVIEDWRQEFSLSCPDDLKEKFYTAFYLLLFERVIATLLVDIPLRRSPFDIRGKEGRERVKNAKKLFVEALKYLLETIPTLAESEPFKENFEALKKIYG